MSRKNNSVILENSSLVKEKRLFIQKMRVDTVFRDAGLNLFTDFCNPVFKDLMSGLTTTEYQFIEQTIIYP